MPELAGRYSAVVREPGRLDQRPPAFWPCTPRPWSSPGPAGSHGAGQCCLQAEDSLGPRPGTRGAPLGGRPLSSIRRLFLPVPAPAGWTVPSQPL